MQAPIPGWLKAATGLIAESLFNKGVTIGQQIAVRLEYEQPKIPN
jgi:hypothetical protein